MKKTLSKRHLMPALLLASAQIATMNTAQANWYTESSILNSDLDDTSLNSTGREVTTTFDEDLGFSSSIGYEYDNGLRLEGEYLSTENNSEAVNFNGNVFTGANARGGIETESLFFNVIKGFNTNGTYSPYVGAGVGFSSIESNISYGPGVANITDSDEVFSYQLLAGLDVAFSKKFSGFVEYRLVTTDDVSLSRLGGGPGGLQTTVQEGNIDLSAFAVGLKYTFN
jgi:opacity protein-like surface antigen